MRTKSMILGAALLAAGVATSMAQSNVYSVNVVGYINIPLTNGFSLVANQLDLDGTGTNNTINTVFSNSLPFGSTVYVYNNLAAGFSSSKYAGPPFNRWVPDATAPINPGSGVFVFCPTATNITVVGNVLQGSLTNPIPSGFSIVSSQVPVSGPMQTALNYQPTINDNVYVYDPVAQGYANFKFAGAPFNRWVPSEPSLSVGQAVFLNSAATKSWNTNFVVQ